MSSHYITFNITPIYVTRIALNERDVDVTGTPDTIEIVNLSRGAKF